MHFQPVCVSDMEHSVLCSIANFAAKLCNELGTDKTTVCSPLCAETALALLALGCKDQAHAELLQALDFPDDETIRRVFTFLTTKLKTINGATLNVANKVYLEKGGELKPDIKKDAEEVFQSSLEQLDFMQKEYAAGKINDWVAEQTNNKITRIITPDVFSVLTRVVIVNAIYFQGVWEIPFRERATYPWPFHVNDTTTINVPMMTMNGVYFNYWDCEELKAQLLQMKYKGDEASMIIVLPDEVEGLKLVLQKLASGYDLMAEIKSIRKIEVDVMIPKFKVETTIDLKKLLPKLGIKSIFDDTTEDMVLLTSGEPLYVTNAIQKALIIVDEKGTEAVVRNMVMDERRLCRNLKKKISFTANRPFLYLLMVHEVPLFIGVYEGSEYELDFPPEAKRPKT